MYQFALTRCIGGRISMNSPSSCATTLVQPSRMCRFSDSALYCVRMYTRRRSELMQLERVMSMMRYCPAKGTAGFARSRVRGKRRSPAPPASNTPRVSLIFFVSQQLLPIDELQLRQSDAQNGQRVPKETRVYHATVDF